MAEANISQGFAVHSGLYRVPDLLTEDQFIDYMKEVYGVTVFFDHDVEPGSADSDLGPTGQSPAKTADTSRRSTKK